MASDDRGGLLSRLLGASAKVLVAAVLTYVAVRLLESIAGVLVVTVVIAVVAVVLGLVFRAVWRARRANRW